MNDKYIVEKYGGAFCVVNEYSGICIENHERESDAVAEAESRNKEIKDAITRIWERIEVEQHNDQFVVHGVASANPVFDNERDAVTYAEGYAEGLYEGWRLGADL